MAAHDITISADDARKISDILAALAFFLTTDDLATTVAKRPSDGPYGTSAGVEPARYADSIGTEPLAENIRELVGRLPGERPW